MTREQAERLIDKYAKMQYTEIKEILHQKIDEFASYDMYQKQTSLEYACQQHIRVGDTWYKISTLDGKTFLEVPNYMPDFQHTITDLDREHDFYYDCRIEIEILLYSLEQALREMTKPNKQS